jgi:diphosphomevalonate decarboxylase
MGKGKNDKETLNLRASCKLLITGEYLALQGAKVLAVPLRFGQQLKVSSTFRKTIRWISADRAGEWFRAELEPQTLRTLKQEVRPPGKPGTCRNLVKLLKAARKLNPSFLACDNGFDVRVDADFPLEWGIGSSSTLISLVARWSGTDPYKLLDMSGVGSGYDVACATASGPVYYSRKGKGCLPVTTEAEPGELLRNNVFFAWLGRKADTAGSVRMFRKNGKPAGKEVKRISSLSEEICKARDPEKLKNLLGEHQEIISRILPEPIRKKTGPAGKHETMKPLGAWGGDFVMFFSPENPAVMKRKLKKMGYRQVFSWKEIVLERNRREPDHAQIAIDKQKGRIRSSTLKKDLPLHTSSWQSPSNIAFIKYWGKKGYQIPANPSLSMTLNVARSQTSVSAFENVTGKQILSVNGDPAHPYIPKLLNVCLHASELFPEIRDLSFGVTTSNTFPASAGIASSASGISAFTLCIMDIVLRMKGKDVMDKDNLRMASSVARLGSGSACRSLYPAYAVWGETPEVKGSSDLRAVPLRKKLHPLFRELKDAVLIVSDRPKAVSSSLGHALMDSHPWAAVRYRQAGENLAACILAMQSGDFDRFAGICETEALSLHALIMTSAGNPTLISPQTLEITQRISAKRREGLPVCYSLDAGPNVHLLYPAESEKDVMKFIRTGLLDFCQDRTFISDGIGRGPGRINLK